MPFAYARLANTVQLTAINTILYTNLSTNTAYIRLITLHNTSDTPQQVSLHLTTPPAAAGVANEIYSELIPAKGTRILEYAVPGLMMLLENELLVAIVENVSTVNVNCYGGLDYAE